LESGKKAGIPLEFPGVSIPDIDAKIGQLENIIRDGIQPRITGLAYNPLKLSNEKCVLIIRVPRSWAMPHRVKDSRRFFSRNANGKYELDIPDVRTAFALSGTTMDKIREFRATRIRLIQTGETPVALRDGPKLILHIVPFGAFDPSVRLDAAALAKHAPQDIGWRRRHNFDGFLIAEHEEPVVLRYLQLFRNGAMELVDSAGSFAHDGHLLISHHLDTMLFEKISTYITSLKGLGVPPPVALMITLAGVSGYSLSIPLKYNWSYQKKSIDKNLLLVPDILIESYESNLPLLLKPAFDSVWNAAGLPHSMHYDEDGSWNPKG
jgi:hypothetical protein